MQGSDYSGKFLFEPAEAAPVGSVLYDEHVRLAGKSRMAAFAGYLMPLWYSSISAEHEAVRQAAGIFDCTHMGAIEVAGHDAAGFLNTATTNDVASLENGGAQYGYILDAAGNVLDDIIIYRRADDRFMVVVNAANEAKIKFYLRQLRENHVTIDSDAPDRRLTYKPSIRDMKDTARAEDCRVDIALQGPRSSDILSALTETADTQRRIADLKPFRFVEGSIQGIDCLMSRTGYTGSRTGFELFVHPQKASLLWELLLEKGKSLGLMPCGLGARDSLRIEAGLPLYGHELAGRFGISPIEAGYGWAVKLQKDFFIGKAPMARIAQAHDSRVVRIEYPGEKGVRPVRPDDGVLNSAGECIGWVLSCAKAADKQIALAYVSRQAAQEDEPVGVYYLARSRSQVEQGRKQMVQKEQTVEADAAGVVVGRFARF